MRIIFMNHYFHPEPDFFSGLPFAKELVRRGHKVEVITGFPNYPGGKVYDGYRIKPIQREIIDGVAVTRIPLYPSHDTSSIGRIACYSTFAISASTIGLLAAKRADVVYVGEGPATMGLPACFFRFFRRIPFVFHILDLWPDSLSSTGMFDNKFGLWAVEKMCQHIYKRSSKIVVYTPGYKRVLCERGVPADKIEIVYSWCTDTQFLNIEKDRELANTLGMAGKFNIVFAGNVGKAQALDSMLEAARLVASANADIQFMIIGDGVDIDRLKQKAAEMNLQNVRFLPRQPFSKIGRILNLADVLFIHLKQDPLFQITIPSKTQASLAIGRPILVAVEGDTTDLIEKAYAGLACNPEDPDSIAQAVLKLRAMPQDELDRMGANGKRFYEQELSSKIGISKFEKIFESVMKNRK